MQKICWKRLQKEHKQSLTPHNDLVLKPVSRCLRRWHFTFKGPRQSVYEEGIYHGLLVLPKTYPYSPPDILLFTRSGRYQIRKRLCLNVTSFHKEEWSPVWTLEQIVRAFRSNFEGKVLCVFWVYVLYTLLLFWLRGLLEKLRQVRKKNVLR